MATTYRWYINQMDTVPDFSGYTYFVSRIMYRYNATNDSGYTANLSGQLTFNEVQDTPQDPYVQYSAITESEVITWLNTYTDVTSLQSQLNTNLDEQMNPPILNLPLPWE